MSNMKSLKTPKTIGKFIIIIALFSANNFSAQKISNFQNNEGFTRLSTNQEELISKKVNTFINSHYEAFKAFELERLMLMPFTEASKVSNASLNKRINDFSSNKGFLYGDITQTNFYQDFSKDIIEHLRHIENRENRLQQERKLAIEKSKNHNQK